MFACYRMRPRTLRPQPSWLRTLLAASTLLAVSAPASGAPPFLHAPASSFDTDYPFTAVAIGDFKEDGIGDVVVAGSTVATHAGLGDGSFQPPLATAKRALPTVARSMAAGDLNHDGHLDVVVANGDAISVLAGFGNGRFAGPVTYASPSTPGSVVLAFLNSDPHLDVVVANLSSNTITVLVGSVTGALTLKGTFPVGGTPGAVAAGDVDEDGDTDLAVSCPAEGLVSVLLGAGDGTFGPPVSYPMTNLGYVALAAIDPDGHLDVLAGGTATTALSLRRGLGDGTFGAETSFETGTSAYGLAVGDWDGDGDPDVVVSGRGCCRGTSNVATFVRNSGGILGDPVDVPAGAGVLALVVGDLDADDRPDVVVMNVTTDPGFHIAFVTVLSGNGGTAGFGRMIPLAAAPHFVRAGDVDGDGVTDLVVFDDALQTHRGLGGGSFASPVSTTTPYVTWAMALGDLDGDGRSDAVVLSSSYVSMLSGLPDGTFGPATSYPVISGISVDDIALGDFDGNGAMDVVVSHQPSSARVAYVMMNDGTGQLGPPLSVTSTSTNASGATVAVADFNGDGRPDLVTTSQSTPFINTFRGAGDGTFVDDLSLGAFTTDGARLAIGDVAAADLDGDGRSDIAVCAPCSAGGPHCDDPHTMAFWRSTNGMVTQGIPEGAGGMRIVAAPLSGDGLADVVVANFWSNTISTYRAGPTGLTRIDHPAGDSPTDLAVADLNGDGRLDVAVADQGPAAIRIFEGAFGVLDAPRAATANGLALGPARPNPASRELRLGFTLPSRGPVSLRVLDVAGRHVATLVDGVQDAGRHEVRWNRRDASGGAARAGVYFCELRAAGARLSTRFAIIQ